MQEKEYRKIESEPYLLKEMKTNVIVETNQDALIKYKATKAAARQSKKRLENLEVRVESMETKLDKILALLAK